MKVRWMIATVLVAGAVACVKDEGPVASGNGKLQILHAAPDASPANVSVDNTVALSNVTFLSQGTVSPAAGYHTITVTAAAGSIHDSPIGVGANQSYDVIVAGTAADGTLQLLGGQNNTPTFDLTKAAGVRVFNVVVDTTAAFSAHADTVDLYFTNPAGQFANAFLSIPGLAQFSPSAAVNGVPYYSGVNPGTYRIRVTAFGDTTTVSADATFTFSAGQLRTIVITSNPDRKTGALALIADN